MEEQKEKQKVGFFQEGVNHNSVNRLVFFIGFIWLMGFCTVLALYVDGVTVPQITVAFTSIAAVLGTLKVSQKYLEKK